MRKIFKDRATSIVVMTALIIASVRSQTLGNCQDGQAGCNRCSTRTGNCIDCQEAYYVLTNGSCGPCVKDCKYCTNGVFCSICKAGTLKNDFGTECISVTSGSGAAVLIIVVLFNVAIVCCICSSYYKRMKKKRERKVANSNMDPNPPPVKSNTRVMGDISQPPPARPVPSQPKPYTPAPNQIQVQPHIGQNQIGHAFPMPNQSPTPLLIGAGNQGAPPEFAFLGPTLLSKYGNMGTFVLKNCQYVGLYFSASWCGPCRAFTPKLAQFYQQANGNNPMKVLEIVFISSDRGINASNAYYAQMPWLAVPFGSPANQNVKSRYPVSGIPKLIVLNRQGITVSDDGRYDVSNYSVNDCVMKWSSGPRF